jgi:iron only hydrogenase large subunit-like protein/nitrogen-specific signal transduction histidine kinase
MKKDTPLITTISEKCKMCYTCVRDCPAKAIRVVNGQAEIVADRCIGCGNCLLVCTQNAKQYYDSIPEVQEIIDSDSKVMAIVAPSFPGAFPELDPGLFVEMLRKIGFNYVCEVGFGADLVAHKYKELIFNNPNRSYIATTCPGIVSYIEKYHPVLVKQLAPVVSPMLATARALRLVYGKDIKIVFIGPCVAKKGEAAKYDTEDKKEIDAVLTFRELIDMIKQAKIDNTDLTMSDFDPPKSGLGALFSLSGGMLQAADMRVNLLNSNILIADGKEDFVRAIKEFHDESYNSNLLELLCCRGCIMGAGMPSGQTYFTRRAAVSKYVGRKFNYTDLHANRDIYNEFLKKDLQMDTSFSCKDTRMSVPSEDELVDIMHKMGKFSIEDELNCGACGYKTCKEHALAIFSGLAESEMCLPSTIERLKKSLKDLSVSKSDLDKAQEALFNAEKLASMGQLSAGIAHEINNPLGVILLNASVLLEDMAEVPELAEFKEDIDLIVEQAERCKKIVSGLLNFARKNKIVLEATNIEELVKHTLHLITKHENIEININTDFTDPIAEIHKDKITQVLINLVTNAIDAMPDGGTIDISASDTENEITIIVKDNGTGIEKKILNKVFEPLFTTKQIGKGTGLGLAVTYGIVKTHKGTIKIVSNTDPKEGPVGTAFTVKLPRKGDS